jgi:hypothetical protein
LDDALYSGMTVTMHFKILANVFYALHTAVQMIIKIKRLILVYSEKNQNGTKEYYPEVTEKYLMNGGDDRAPSFPVSSHCCIFLHLSLAHQPTESTWL